MSATASVNDCCSIELVEGARFCVKCGRKHTNAELARAVPRPPKRALPEAINCHGCQTPLPITRLLEPIHEMFRETAEDNELARQRPSAREEAISEGQTLLPDLEILQTRLRDRFLTKSDHERDLIWEAQAKSDPMIGAFDTSLRIARQSAMPRGGHRLRGLVVQPCAKCGQKDPAGLMAAAEQAQHWLSTRRSMD